MFLFLYKNVLWVLIRIALEAILMCTHDMFLWRSKNMLAWIPFISKAMQKEKKYSWDLWHVLGDIHSLQIRISFTFTSDFWPDILLNINRQHLKCHIFLKDLHIRFHHMAYRVIQTFGGFLFDVIP